MRRAHSNNQRTSRQGCHALVWFALIAALLALRFVPPNLTVTHGHEVLLKQAAAHDKRACVQSSHTELSISSGAASLAPVLTEFELLPHQWGSNARESNTTICDRAPPLV